jgi:hypothetical protein
MICLSVQRRRPNQWERGCEELGEQGELRDERIVAILHELVLADRSGVWRDRTVEMGVNFGVGQPDLLLRFKHHNDSTPLLKGKLVSDLAREFLIADRFGHCWRVKKRKWKTVSAQKRKRRKKRITPRKGKGIGLDLKGREESKKSLKERLHTRTKPVEPSTL